MTKPRVFFYVQHLLGIGHSMRAALIARAMTEIGLDVTLVNGGEATEIDNPGSVDFVQLPPARAADASFSSIVDDQGNPIDDTWKSRRRTALLDAFKQSQADATLIETFPFGRWPFRFEILPLIDTARKSGAVLCSIRDILVPKANPERNRQIATLTQEQFDGVLVHGDRNLVPLDDTFIYAADIEAKTFYTGYVAPPPEPSNSEAKDRIIVSAGGGGTGEILIAAALELVADISALGLQWHFLTGPNAPPSITARLQATSGIISEPVRRDFRALLAGAALSVSQAGYNTVLDVLVSQTRNVLVPFSRFGQTEQAMRANLLADKGMTITIDEQTLSPTGLLSAIKEALRMKKPDSTGIDFNGAKKTARLVQQFATNQQ